MARGIREMKWRRAEKQVAREAAHGEEAENRSGTNGSTSHDVVLGHTVHGAIEELKRLMLQVAIEVERRHGMPIGEFLDEVQAGVSRRIRGEDLREVAPPARRFVDDYVIPTAQAMGKDGFNLQIGFQQAIYSS